MRVLLPYQKQMPREWGIWQVSPFAASIQHRGY
jgi:hypothetical protein